MKRRWLPWMFVGGGALVFVLLQGLEARHLRSVQPPEGAQTLDRFAQGMPPPEQLWTFRKEGKPFLLWSGPAAPGILLHSGPPTYVFDDSGRLVDWTPNRGDHHDFDHKWGWPEVVAIPLDEALQKFKPR